jgi:hypothetical protein
MNVGALERWNVLRVSDVLASVTMVVFAWMSSIGRVYRVEREGAIALSLCF